MPTSPRCTEPLELIAHQAARGGAVTTQLASLGRAMAGGADRIELDVVRLGRRLLVAHDLHSIHRGDQLELSEALAAVAAAQLPVLLDIKGSETARALGEYLAGTDWPARTLLTGDPGDVELAGSVSGARRAWTLPASARSWPDARAGWFGAATGRARGRVAAAAVSAIRAGRTDDVCVDRRFVTHALAGGVRAAGGGLAVWTVDHPREARRLAALGVDALITNQPAAIRACLVAPEREVDQG
jgi:hypothetical protein